MSGAAKLPTQPALSPCPSCGGEKVYTIGYQGTWWCECRSCGDEGARQQSAGAAMRAWEDHVAIERETNGRRAFAGADR